MSVQAIKKGVGAGFAIIPERMQALSEAVHGMRQRAVMNAKAVHASVEQRVEGVMQPMYDNVHSGIARQALDGFQTLVISVITITILIIFAFNILEDQQADLTVNGWAYNATVTAFTTLNKIPGYVKLIVGVFAAIIIIILLRRASNNANSR